MIDVRLNKILLESYETKQVSWLNSEMTWQALLRVELSEVESGEVITENYFLNIVSDNYQNSLGIQVDLAQEQLDFVEIYNLVIGRLAISTFTGWEEFHSYMQDKFITE